MRSSITAALWLMLVSLSLADGTTKEALATFKKEVWPVLEAHCVKCHGPDKQKARLRLDELNPDLIGGADAETWHDVQTALDLGEMPPEDEEQLSEKDRATLVNWLRQEMERVVEVKRSTGGQVVLRRLNRFEYNRTMQDLLGLDLDFARDLPPESLSEDGFQNNGSVLGMTALQLEYYLKAARAAMEKAIVTTPEPRVVEHTATESVADKGKGNWTNRLGRSGTFVARMTEFPDEGEFVIRLKARAEVKEAMPHPRMRVELGYRADTQTPRRVLGVVDVSSKEGQVFEFRGRVSEFPQQSGKQSKYPGMLVWATNVYDDGKPATKSKQVVEEVILPNGKKKKTKKTIWPEDSDFPKIVVESFEFAGPIFESWPPEHHSKILFSSDKKEDEKAYAVEVLQRFMERAYRRPIETDEVEGMIYYYERIRPDTESFEVAMREVLSMVLISPDFLYLIEPAGKDGKRALSGYELASRLSYFLWSTMPDQRMLELANSGKLNDDAVLRKEVGRMLSDERSWAFVERFADQWLDLGGLDRVAVNPEYYAEFDNDLKPDMRKETHHFFAEILYKDISALNFIDSDFAMLNEPLARHYGIPGPKGSSSFERVVLKPEDGRGGLLAQASILTANSTGEDSHPIKRGVWILERLLHDPPAPPPPNVPDLDQENPEFAKLPLKQQLEIHRKDPACMNCHQGIDPWGIALEQYDAVGLLRDEVRRKTGKGKGGFTLTVVDASDELPGGEPVNGLEDLKSYLLAEKREQFAEALASKMLAYALGRSLELSDEQTVEELTESFISDNFRLSALIGRIVTCEEFRTK